MQLIKVVIGGQEFEGDFLNPDIVEKYEKAIDKAVAAVTEVDENDSASQWIRKQCNAICECADEILGEGSSKKIFSNGVDLLSCMDVYRELCCLHDVQVAPRIREKAFKYSAERAKREGKHSDR